MQYWQIIQENGEWIDETWQKLVCKLSRTAIKSRNKIPYTTENGTHDDYPTVKKDIQWWTNGFWGGLMWLLYSATKDERYKITAEISEKRLDGAFNEIWKMNHDTGFIWHILSGANYRLTSNQESKNRNLLAAMILASRYNATGGFIRCWNGKDRGGWTIIDSMMNLAQLYWASEELEDSRFKKIAMNQADITLRDHVREDGSVNHIVVHDVETGKGLEMLGGQGYAQGSCWARGSAWVIYGFMISYIHTEENRYLETAKKAAKYFIEETKKTDWLPRLDFRQPQTPMYYDSTAGAIAACGLIEIGKHVPQNEQEYYLSAAIAILKAMEENWCDWSEKQDGILQMGSASYVKEIHQYIIYGDYFFVEAILKLKGNDFFPW